ncbi:serine hydrolase [Rhizobiales bacterium RZME27]|uniref:Serine hydrolase n=1 Tax=Endobacterium cereale TaxID=2663029 RepID=A0A6A8AF79_9HYPH|nr:serine hydrolase [Endobacterium cereale]MEB2843998.1 serine hydrolase [Endobacterium cereale]MQY48410.1 serine hydrolase [Endobacterium cereale]
MPAPKISYPRILLNTVRIAPAFTAIALLAGAQTAGAEEAYPHAKEKIGTVEQIYDGALTPDLAVSTFRNVDRLFPTRTIKAGGRASELSKSENELGKVSLEVDDETYDLYDYLALNQVSGLIVLKNGKVVYETYQRGNTEKTRWMSMSVAKSISSTLVGAAIKDGLIKSLDDNVVTYVPRLKGTAYDGVSVRDVLMMSSGVKWNEKYTDPASDRRALLKAQIAQKAGGAMDVMAKLPRTADPGTVNNYSTGETQVLAEILHGAIKKPLADYLSEKIWTPYGMEADAKWWLESPDGIEIGGSGLSATLRDFARFGQFVLEDGKAGDKAVLPEGWVKEASTPKTLKGAEALEYGYMWWTGWTDAAKKDGAFSAVGIQGQYVYINPAHNVVIAQTAAEPKPTDKEAIDPMAFFDAIVAAVK